MTFEELKAEADRQGYNLVKKHGKMPKLLKCPFCGRVPKVRWEDFCKFTYVSCPTNNCLCGPEVDRVGLRLTKVEAERQAREAWNEMIKSFDVTIGDIFGSLPEEEKNKIYAEMYKVIKQKGENNDD